MWYRDGTYSFEKESTKVTGTGTSWADAKFGVLPGMIMIDADGRIHEIDRVISNNELYISEPYTGESVADIPSRIITTYEGDLSQFSARFSALLKSISTDSRQISKLLTSPVPVTITRDDGTTFVSDSLETIAKKFSDSQQWLAENKDAVSASGDMAKQAAESASEAKQSEKATELQVEAASESAKSSGYSAEAAKASAEAAALSSESAGKQAEIAASVVGDVSQSASQAAASATKAEDAATNADVSLQETKNYAYAAGVSSDNALQASVSAGESAVTSAKSAGESATSATEAGNHAATAAAAVKDAVSEVVLAASKSAESAKASEAASKASQDAASSHESYAKESEGKAAQSAADAAETLSKMSNDAATAESASVSAKASEVFAAESLKAVKDIAELVSGSAKTVEDNVAEVGILAESVKKQSENAARAAADINDNIGNAVKSAKDAAASAELAQKVAAEADEKVNNPVFSKTVQAAYTESTVPADQLNTKAAFYNDIEADGESEYHPIVKQRVKIKGVSRAASFGWMISDLLFNLQLINDKGERRDFGFGTNGDLVIGGKIIPGDYTNFNELYLRRSSDVVQTVNSEIEFKQRMDVFGSDGSRVRLYCNKDGDAGISYQDKDGNWQTGLKLPISGGGDFAMKGDHYTKIESDTKYQQKGNYAQAGISYTKSESDSKYQQKGNYAPSDSDVSFISGTHTIKTTNDYASLILRRGNGTAIFLETNVGAGNIIHRDAKGTNIAVLGIPVKSGEIAVAGEHYTKPESDSKYRAKNDLKFDGSGVFGGIVSAVKDNIKIEIKAENGVPEITSLHGSGDWKIHALQPVSGTLAHKEDHYTKLESDGKYQQKLLRTIKFGSSNSAWSTAQFIEWLKSQGAFSSGYWVSRGTWDYAGNQFINDTGVGNIHLAGCVVQVFGYHKQCTITIITPTTTASGTTHREYIYVDNDSNYNPGWRRLYNTSAPPTAAEVGAYTKGESDGKYQPKGAYAGAAAHTFTGEVRSPSIITGGGNDLSFFMQRDGVWAWTVQQAGAWKGEVKHPGRSGTFALQGDSYTKGESDGKYQPKGSYAGINGNDGQDFRGKNANFLDVYIRSDIRVKSELRRIEQPLRKIQMISGCSYNLKASDGNIKPSAGLIAQEVREVMPEAVTQDDNGLLRLNYNSVIGLLVEAVKDLKNQVDSLKK
ncbi:tail fiber domain-containing protein [Morganella psychrotolerans]|uniref:Tail fiber domain-containing protein n=3 Tax=Morganella psychrotolerans TaxID=368603 RepID=A0A5M9QYB1_9GAMM|nr:tail fiber domain-containing protein [Morganella psychrotolerans]KAA8713037.1 tail fiber domain-containing protein [Morganella psychrotolerans]